MITETIAAIATPFGSGGIGVIRISGPGALDVISGIFGKTKTGPFDSLELKSHRVYHGYIFDRNGSDIIDEVLLIPMLAPSSYTAEDVVEIQAHSGTIVLQSILDLVLSKGARMAEPGEFTKRAFLNQRIDLTQAEAVSDIINARSSAYLKFAASQNTGVFKKQIQQFCDSLMNLLARVEASIDFPDDTDSFTISKQDIRGIDQILAQCCHLIQQHQDACFLKDGIRLVICGAPNVGKSSLMNQLLAKDRSIVTPTPGTTRDLIEEGINIGGVPFLISDTAGIHKTDDLVEIIGIEKAKDNIRSADLVLLVKEPGSLMTLNKIHAIVPPDKDLILVLNKTDLIQDKTWPELPEELQHIPRIEISALYNTGIDKLKDLIIHLSIKGLDLGKSSIIPNLRHKKALEAAVTELTAVKYGLEHNSPHETLAIDIKNSMDALGVITGQTAGTEVLDVIFSNFCIGK